MPTSAPYRFPVCKTVSFLFAACSLLAFLTLPSKAGTWVITYANTGKTSYDTIQPPTSLVNHTTNNALTSSSASATTGSGIVDAQANASIVATLTWQPASGQTMTTDPPPTTPVSILETASASESPGPWEGSGPAPTTPGPAGTVDDGLKDPQPAALDANGRLTCSGSHLIQKDGSSGTIPLDKVVMSAACPQTVFSSTGTPNWEQSISAHVSLTVQVSPVSVTITPGGATPDSSGNYNILVGQQCTASLSVTPSTYTVSNYQWSVSNNANTFQSWAFVSDGGKQSHTTEVDGPGLLTNSTASWFWDEQIGSGKSATETITCTVTVKPPTGQGSAYPVTVTQPVSVYVPNWTCTGNGGMMRVSTAAPNGNGTDYYLYAGPASGSDTGSGMDLNATVSAPTAPIKFGAGVLEIVQTETPNSTYTSSAGTVYNRSNNKQQGLDSACPYPWLPPPPSPPSYEAGDSPNFDLTEYSATSAQLNLSFVDTLMYEPPNSSQYVPLATFPWSVNGSVQLTGPGGWANYGSGSTGSLTPSGTQPFTPSDVYPSWKQNVGNGTFTWVAAN